MRVIETQDSRSTVDPRSLTTTRSLSTEIPDVAILEWPAEAEQRGQLARLGLPRLLLVPVGAQPPRPLDGLEDWIRSPADPFDLLARSEHLRSRVEAMDAPVPVLDEDGLVWVGQAWVAVTLGQVPVARLLVDNCDRVVRFELLVEAYVAGGGSDHPGSVRTLLSRLGTRLAPLGLELVTVRRRGMLLKSGANRPPT